MTGYSIAEFLMQKAMSPTGAWEELHKYYMPKTVPATHRLKREFETICMVERGPPVVPW